MTSLKYLRLPSDLGGQEVQGSNRANDVLSALEPCPPTKSSDVSVAIDEAVVAIDLWSHSRPVMGLEFLQSNIQRAVRPGSLHHFSLGKIKSKKGSSARIPSKNHGFENIKVVHDKNEKEKKKTDNRGPNLQ